MVDQPESPIFINSILKQGKTRPVLVAQTVDVGAVRQIRHHKKSRRGCVGCKLRRVKCDERQPCSSCLKRGIQCRSPLGKEIAARQVKPEIDLGLGPNSQMSLLQLELFHHWDKHTRSTLVYPEIWPVIMQHAFHENFVMASILCTSAMHLSTLHPQSTKYSDLANWLMPRSISLFRQSLSKPLTKDNAEAIVGAALLVNYISWFDLSFLHDDASTVDALVLDPLLLVSSGVTHAWFQTIPILIEGKSVFLSVMTHHPRLIIEQALAQRGDSADLFVQPLMNIWDDTRYQSSGSLASNPTVHAPASNRAWRLLQDLESELLPADPRQRQKLEQCDEPEKLRQYKDEVTKITSNSNSANNPLVSPETMLPSQARASFAYIVRRISPLIHCQALASCSNAGMSDLAAIQDDIEQLIYGFPILCCGPFTDLVQRKDTRALVLLLHFYRSARILLDLGRCWWAGARTSVMEELIVNELKLRGLSSYLDNLVSAILADD